ncbi:hypothetical protein [Bacillus sp. V59.32b]|uniref:hypothetical protein n=1 Tax=Bacillus sp. V59.32b TaxID=1758642 RepID=UPI000E3E44FD|nr:hypothetical protein [Bacillus sp. V59.32b]RFU61006.1 hypothetical protein D0463_15750 [Bacillus sp. V59.32b]
MKYQQRDFTPELRAKIEDTERVLKNHIELVLRENKSVFAEGNLDLSLHREGQDPFKPGYSSSILTGAVDEDGELIDLHIINIWESERVILRLPISKNIPGSKVIGELIDELLEEVKLEIKEYMEEQLEPDAKK